MTLRGKDAKVLKAKGVSFNYLQTIWTILGQVIKMEAAGDYASAMKMLCVNVNIFTEDVNEALGQEAELIEKGMNLIINNQIPALRAESDLFLRGIKREKLLQFYSCEHLKTFKRKLFAMLESKGYLDQQEDAVITGQSHTYR